MSPYLKGQSLAGSATGFDLTRENAHRILTMGRNRTGRMTGLLLGFPRSKARSGSLREWPECTRRVWGSGDAGSNPRVPTIKTARDEPMIEEQPEAFNTVPMSTIPANRSTKPCAWASTSAAWLRGGTYWSGHSNNAGACQSAPFLCRYPEPAPQHLLIMRS